METTPLWYILKYNFFSEFTEEERQRLASLAEMVPVSKGQIVQFPHQWRGSIWLVKRGLLQLFRYGHEGRTIALDVIGPGEVVGELSAVSEAPDADGLEALEPSLLCRVPVEFLRAVCERNPKAALCIVKRQWLKRMQIENRLTDILFCPVRTRVARLLLHLKDRFGKSEPGGCTLSLRLRHRDMAALVGANREAITRTLSAMRDEGIIAYRGSWVVIKNEEKLKKLAQQ
jgi:CRP-like cAMP-binding protein